MTRFYEYGRVTQSTRLSQNPGKVLDQNSVVRRRVAGHDRFFRLSSPTHTKFHTGLTIAN